MVLNPKQSNMYKKLGLFEVLIGNIADLADKNGLELTNKEKYEYKGLPPYEEAMDVDNIHDSLQGKMERAEENYAELVTELLKKDAEIIKSIKEVCYNFGKRNGIKSGNDAIIAFEEMIRFIVDGMPCDNTKDIITWSNEEIVWVNTKDLHEEYWINAGGDVRNYYILNEEIMRGFLFETGFEFSIREDGKFRIGH